MILKKLNACSFRNIKNAQIEFSEGTNLLIGENAQGKTNVIEAIYLFVRGKSFRGSDEKELLRFGDEGFRISVEYEDKNGLYNLEYAVFGRERRRLKNGVKLSGQAELIGNLKAVLFSPDDLSFVKGGPDMRRAFLNVAISQCYPSYIGIYSNYKKTLENRNSLLKKASKGEYIDENELLSWSYELAEYASRIYLYRIEYLKKLEVYAKEFMKSISENKEEISVYYDSEIEKENIEEIKEEYKKVYTAKTDKEKIVGTTLYGPHRDDIRIDINEKDSRKYASQGQQRSIVLSFKLSEGEVIKELFGEYPIYLFDDVLSELDEKRRKFVIEGLEGKQLILSLCEKIDKIDEKARIIRVAGGEYK